MGFCAYYLEISDEHLELENRLIDNMETAGLLNKEDTQVIIDIIETLVEEYSTLDLYFLNDYSVFAWHSLNVAYGFLNGVEKEMIFNKYLEDNIDDILSFAKTLHSESISSFAYKYLEQEPNISWEEYKEFTDNKNLPLSFYTMFKYKVEKDSKLLDNSTQLAKETIDSLDKDMLYLGISY